MRIKLMFLIAMLVVSRSFAQAPVSFESLVKDAHTVRDFATLHTRFFSGAFKSEALASVAVLNQRAYVYELQVFLTAQKLYFGQETGALDVSTTRALARFCVVEGFSAECKKGPLGPTSVSLVARAIEKIATHSVTVFSGQGLRGAAVGSPGVFPPGWSVGGGGEGLSSEVVAVNAHAVSVRIHGAALGDGLYYNLVFGEQKAFPVKAGMHLTMSLKSSLVSSAPIAPDVKMRIALWDVDGKYVGELFDGKTIGQGREMSIAAAVGEVPNGAAFGEPYIQVLDPKGTPIDLIIEIEPPTVTSP